MWHEWDGTGQPPTGWVEIECKDGGFRRGDAKLYRWQHVGEIDDIVRWRRA